MLLVVAWGLLKLRQRGYAGLTELIDSKREGLLYSARTYVWSGGPANSLP